jgi:hypothetical protein
MSRSIEFSRRGEGVVLGKRCLAPAADDMNPNDRDTL